MENFCFMIQPFDGGKFDKRYEDIYKPAIIAAGLDVYRVDADDLAQVPIDTIEEKIRAAAICVADITLNNPNVWYEVGYAYASNKIVVLVCSDERTEEYPFDVRSRNILNYKTESASDYQEFQKKLTKRINKLKTVSAVMAGTSEGTEIDNFVGLTCQEIIFLGIILSIQNSIDEPVSAGSVKAEMIKTGLNSIAFNICMRKLLAKEFINIYCVNRVCEDEEYCSTAIDISLKGNEWILENEDKFYDECFREMINISNPHNAVWCKE